MKIKNKILTKLTNLTECEWKLFEYMIRRQDNSGKVFGVHNKAVCQTTKMSKQSFYNALRGLAEKKVITYEAGVPEYTVNPVAKHKIFGRSIDYNVTIIDNDFSYEGAEREGYVSLQRKLFRSKEYASLKANEKFLLFWFAHLTNENTQSYKRKAKEFLGQYSAMLGVSKRVVRSYMHTLKNFFAIGVKKGICYITYLHEKFEKDYSSNQRNNVQENYIQGLVRHMKIKKASTRDIKDTAYLMSQYDKLAELHGRDIKLLITKIICSCARKEKEPKNRVLNAKYIHKILRSELALF